MENTMSCLLALIRPVNEGHSSKGKPDSTAFARCFEQVYSARRKPTETIDGEEMALLPQLFWQPAIASGELSVPGEESQVTESQAALPVKVSPELPKHEAETYFDASNNEKVDEPMIYFSGSSYQKAELPNMHVVARAALSEEGQSLQSGSSSEVDVEQQLTGPEWASVRERSSSEGLPLNRQTFEQTSHPPRPRLGLQPLWYAPPEAKPALAGTIPEPSRMLQSVISHSEINQEHPEMSEVAEASLSDVTEDQGLLGKSAATFIPVPKEAARQPEVIRREPLPAQVTQLWSAEARVQAATTSTDVPPTATLAPEVEQVVLPAKVIEGNLPQLELFRAAEQAAIRYEPRVDSVTPAEDASLIPAPLLTQELLSDPVPTAELKAAAVPFRQQLAEGVDSGVRQVRLQREPGALNLRMELHPRDLGELNVHLRLEGDRLMVHFEANSSQASGLLEQHLPELREQLLIGGFAEVILGAATSDQMDQERRDSWQRPTLRPKASSGRRDAESLAPRQVQLQSASSTGRLDYRV